MKIVLTDAQTVLDNLVNADILKQFGEVEEYGLLRYDEVAGKIADADMVVCNKTLLDKNTLRLAKNLKYIGLFATGYNNIDIDYCKAHNIAVCNAGSYSTNAVAQHPFALILEHFNTANILPSTLSVATSFIAVYLTFRRSPYFALAYAANDVVLIVLWILAAKESISYLSVIICCLMFLVNDLYGFVSWKRMEQRQLVPAPQ